MLDGVHFGEHVCVVALGIGIDGTQYPLAVAEGDTENTTVVTELLVGLRERGLDTNIPILVVIDGAKALKAAVTRVFDHPVIARCRYWMYLEPRCDGCRRIQPCSGDSVRGPGVQPESADTREASSGLNVATWPAFSP
jgi:hypothetical protein